MEKLYKENCQMLLRHSALPAFKPEEKTILFTNRLIPN